MRSVLQDWVMELPLREQGALVVGMRGCDDTPKLPLDSTERKLTGYLRFCALVPVDMRELEYEGGFFVRIPPSDYNWKPSELGHYPLHWFTHLMHGYQIVGYRHPNRDAAYEAAMVYRRLVHSLHLNVELAEEMTERYAEDRISNNTVVS